MESRTCLTVSDDSLWNTYIIGMLRTVGGLRSDRDEIDNDGVDNGPSSHFRFFKF